MKVRCRRLPHGQDLPFPRRASSGSAGFDLVAALDRPSELAPGDRGLIPTGLVLEIPPGWEAQVRPRSGLALQSGLTVLNSPGTIDSDYRGEVGVILVNLGAEAVTVRRGDRIAQVVFAPVAEVEWEEAESLGASERGAGGFGSSGTS
ncbi:MAG: dUTP diphosphatase [Thermoanaerobaculia bacterium]